MSYDISYGQWENKVEWNSGRCNPRPTPMRPIGERTMWSSPHFIIMEGKTTPFEGWARRGVRVALIEPWDMKVPITRIDARLKSIRQIIAIKEVFNEKHPKAHFIRRRFFNELVALAEKCERLYPMHFILKGVNYEPPKAAMDVENNIEAQE